MNSPAVIPSLLSRNLADALLSRDSICRTYDQGLVFLFPGTDQKRPLPKTTPGVVLKVLSLLAFAGVMIKGGEAPQYESPSSQKCLYC